MADRLSEALTAARQRYVDAHPISRQLAARAGDVLPGGNTRSVLHIDPFGFRVARADGAVLHDVDGHRYVDLLGDYSAGLLGRNAGVADTIRAVLDRGWSYGAMSEPETTFAEAVVARFPSIEQVRFTNSGSEANIMALLTARHATGRQRFVVFEDGYHGGPLYFGHGGRPLQLPFDWLVLPYNDVASATTAVARGDIAAVLVEPMLGSGGCIPADPAFLAALRAATTAHGTVLIFDEVMTSRLALGGAQELLGITPDLTTLGKYLAGGLSFGAFGGRRHLMAAYDPAAAEGGLTHGGTFNNNAFTMAVGAAVHESTITGDALQAVNERGDRLREGLNARFASSPIPFCCTGWGSILAVHPVAGPVRAPADLADADARWRELLFHDLLAAGFYLAPRGYLALTMDVTDDDAGHLLEAVEAFLDRRRACTA